MKLVCIICAFTYMLLIAAPGNLHAQPDQPSAESFNQNWKFYLGEANDAASESFNDAGWRSLQLPHDWSIELPFDSTSPTGTGGGALRGGMGWYRKALTLPSSSKGKNVFIDFDGVYCNSEFLLTGIPWVFVPMDLFRFVIILRPG